MRIEFTTASKRHKIGRAHVRYLMATCTPSPATTNRGEPGWRYVGPDDRGVVLEVIAVVTDRGNLLVIHVMPHAFRGGN
ncbi:MAG TPA: hypothetical protein VNG13_08455 [Mycobacteriales bacterium]|nr:hypothetical protein [Mycobacteriales bacterium]